MRWTRKLKNWLYLLRWYTASQTVKNGYWNCIISTKPTHETTESVKVQVWAMLLHQKWKMLNLGRAVKADCRIKCLCKTDSNNTTKYLGQDEKKRHVLANFDCNQRFLIPRDDHIVQILKRRLKTRRNILNYRIATTDRRKSKKIYEKNVYTHKYFLVSRSWQTDVTES